ncbi:hypothetical protein GCM10020358_50660 [Amorphoplanes nipponensis]|uniref:DUF2716 domain-containing protein n=1 Tax=Actinoplanes nipponensis TaxID=135950 RepID=A0A919JB45_9ACTN|nr:DUF2716 domain-containing protein [Actinoplanes nipponensis]GIE47428.1 hypothetical protein Ani05nite_09620 [Actinoplanes nipponensis]
MSSGASGEPVAVAGVSQLIEADQGAKICLVNGPGWDNDAWQQIRNYEQFWTPFDDRFHFRPGMDPSKWPAIKEPAGSVTFDLSSVFERAGSFSADEDALNEQVLSAMTAVFSADLPLVALDWQHTSYWFWPHRQAVEGQSWRVSAFPNGDYHAFITQDLEQGTFGHPWEQTICVFGRDLTEVLVPEFALWLPVKRKN